MSESIVCFEYPNCDRRHAGGAGGVPVHPPTGSRISGDEPLIRDEVTAEPVARPAPTGPVPVSLAQIVAALSVTYKPPGVAIWLGSMQRDGGVSPLTLLRLGHVSDVADLVRAIGDADPADFEIVDRSER